MSETSASESFDAKLQHSGVPTLGWAFRRALLGLVLVILVATGGAVLLHASIEPEAIAKTPAGPTPERMISPSARVSNVTTPPLGSAVAAP